jgi:hypothetical protein
MRNKKIQVTLVGERPLPQACLLLRIQGEDKIFDSENRHASQPVADAACCRNWKVVHQYSGATPLPVLCVLPAGAGFLPLTVPTCPFS